MIKTITEFDFVKSFDDVNRSSNFSVAGRKALFEMFEELSPDMELDPIAVCCDFTEYESLEEWKQDYGYTPYDEDEDDEDALQYLRDQTLVLELANGGIIIQAY
tara:strand:+ start:3792 stop:4103 length:312 start_codon:yes stop_codon:yes gene_type:complete